jgi:PleD family two-component response regulator
LAAAKVRQKKDRIVKSMRPKTEKVLVFGKKNDKIRELERILAEQFHCICLVTDLNDIASLVANDYFDVIVVTDSMGDMNKDFFSDLRILFPDARVLCLVDQITLEMEMVMRSIRLIFLGSYEYFGKNYQDILKSALKYNMFE